MFVQHSHNTPNQRKQAPKHISGGPRECVYVYVWADFWWGWESFYSYIQPRQIFFKIHSILPTVLLCFPLQLMVQTLTQKEKIIGRVEKQN